MDAQFHTSELAVSQKATSVPSSPPPGTPSTRLSGRRLVRARVAWGTVASLLIGLNVLLLPAYWAQLRTVCTGVRCALAQPSPAGAEGLQSLGLSVAGYADLTLAASLLASLICFVVAGVIVWRKSDDWMALAVALSVVVLGTALVPNQIETGHTTWQLPALTVDVLNFTLLFLLAVLFPSGRFVPRWTRWLVLGWAVAGAVVVGILLISGVLWLDEYEAIWVGAAAGVLAAQVYRYRAVSGARERAQTRWVVLGLSVIVVIGIGLTTPMLLLPDLSRPGSLYNLLSPPVGALAISVFSLSLGMAILRHRLYDIDVIIRRTVVYGTLTGTLALIYASSILGAQVVVEAVGGRQPLPPVVIVASTLLIAALVRPLRGHFQATIDRRFYRRKYDAAKTVAAFGQTLRHEVELGQLSEHLLVVVTDVMQPSQVSLWLVQPPRREDPLRWLHAGVDASDASAPRLPQPVPLPGRLAMPDGTTS